jgi:hypothetical protein
MSIAPNDLAIAILHFNLLPSRYLHASLRPEYFPNELIDDLFASDQVEVHLSNHLLKTLALQNTGYFDEQWPHWTLVLAPDDKLSAYAQAAGCLLLRHALQHTVQRERVMYYRQQLGALYPFILEKGPLLYPGYSAITIAPEQLLDKAQELGWLTLRQAASLFPTAIQQRFLLRLPRDIMTLNVHDTTLTAQQALILLTRIGYEMSAR